MMDQNTCEAVLKWKTHKYEANDRKTGNEGTSADDYCDTANTDSVKRNTINENKWNYTTNILGQGEWFTAYETFLHN